MSDLGSEYAWCASGCGRSRVYARGLCKACYQRELMAHRLADWPTLPPRVPQPVIGVCGHLASTREARCLDCYRLYLADWQSRFWAKVDKSGDCWVWTAGTKGPSRGFYGEVTVAQRVLAAHRVAYELLVGPIPQGLVIDHLCRNTRCVNPAHLEPVTIRENAIERGISPKLDAYRQGRCVRGHDRPARTRCRVCRAANQRRYMARQRAAA